MEKINFVDGQTKGNAATFNQMQDNVENAINNMENAINNMEKAVNTIIVQTANTNLDDYKTEGTYYFSSSHTPVNIPIGSNGLLKVMVGTNVVKQIWYRHGSANNHHQTFVRTCASGDWLEWMPIGSIKIITGTETATNEYIDGKQVYVKRVTISSLPNAASGYYDTGISLSYTPQRIDGLYSGFPINFHFGTAMQLSHGTYIREDKSVSTKNWVIEIITGADRTALKGYVDVYYTKN